MRHGNYSDNIETVDWKVLKLLWPYLWEFKKRVLIAIFCLIFAKIASVSLPFILKYIVDDLDSYQLKSMELIVAPISLILAYGLVRFSNVLLGEIRDTLFGRVTERAIRRVGLEVFQHLHQLELDFHLTRRTGGLSRDIERGTSGISFLLRFMIFNIVPTLLEIALVIVLLLINYGWDFATVTFGSIATYIAFSFVATEWRTKFIREANKADSSSNFRAIDSLLNYETVKYFTNEDYEAERYDTELEKWEWAKRKSRLSLFALNSG